MNQDDFKRYSVIVGNGSGCLFQPMTKEYTYILTAKHLFYDQVEDDRGIIKSVEKADGSIIEIRKQIQNKDTWTEETIIFSFRKGETYFPHEEADIAILKINPALDGFDMINSQESFINEIGFELCGFPESFRNNNEGDKWTSHTIDSFKASGNFSHNAQLFEGIRQENIEGMSGGGLLKVNENCCSIVGIQSKMASELSPTGQVGFVPIKYAKEIIKYKAYAGKLDLLLPIHLISFEFLRDESFLLEVDAIHEENINGARVTLRNKAINIIKSDITPYGIKELFKYRLLIVEKDHECLSFRMIWIAWLEFLTILNIVKYENLEISMLSEIFNSYRLKYINADDWTNIDLRNDLGKSDYLGLKPNSTVFICSKKPAKTGFIIPKGKLINISKPYDRNGFRTDKGIDPFTSFDFVHIDFFKTKCIINKVEEYENMNEHQLIEKLKLEYNELFK